MSKISIYEVAPVPKLADKLIGTSVGGVIEDITYNFTLQELLTLFIPNIPQNTLQGVLDYGNTATQNINLTGTINTTNINVGAIATILNSYLTGETHITGGLYDRLNSVGTAGQVLRSTGTKVEWFTIPTVIPNLQQVLTSGNTADLDIILDADIEALNINVNTASVFDQLILDGSLRDYNGYIGASGQVLTSTGSAVAWVNLPVYTATSPLSIDNITKVISIQQASSTQSGYLSSLDWITFDGKQDAISLTTSGSSGASTFVSNTLNIPNYTLAGLGGVPQTRILTINGVSYNLSEDRTWTIAAGVGSVGATAPLSSTGGGNPVISISQSDTSTDGYLSSTDWDTFNNKQDEITLTTTGTSGPSTLVGSTLNIPDYGSGLTGYVPYTGATGPVNLGPYNLTVNSLVIGRGTSTQPTNIAIGNSNTMGVYAATGASNTAIGVNALAFLTTGYENTAIGSGALTSVTTGYYNVGVGNGAGSLIQLGINNTFIGRTSGANILSGSGNTIIGGWQGDNVTVNNVVLSDGYGNLRYRYDGTNNNFYQNVNFASTLGNGTYTYTLPSATGTLALVGDLSAYVPTSRTLSINGVTYDLSADRSWTITAGVSSVFGRTGNVVAEEGDYSLNQLSDVTLTTPSTGQVLKYSGTEWVNSSDIGLTSVGVSMPSAFTVSNSPLTSNGTIAITGAGVASQYIRGDGQLANFPTNTGGGSSVSYYLNGGTSQGTILGNPYYEMSKSAVIGTNADFNISTDGYIANFITDAGDPALLEIPGGNWNFEIFFSTSSSGGTPSFYVELYKYDGTTFTLISDNSVSPEGITGGTAIDLYVTALAVPETTLTINDRLAIRIYVFNSGRTITLHTQDSHLCQVITTFSTGISALNGLTDQVQYFATGTSGTDFAINSVTNTHTFNLPTASATNRGALSTTDWTTFNDKIGGIGTINYLPKFTSSGVIGNSIAYDGGSSIGINTNAPYDSSQFKLDVNGGLLVKNTSGVTAQIVLINANPAGGGNEAFIINSVGGTSSASWGQIQTYYGLSVPDGALRLQPSAGQVLIGTITPSAFTLDVNGSFRATGQITLGSTISNGTYSYTLPSATGTLALLSDLNGYVPTSRTLTINGVTYDLSADRSWSITAGVSSVSATSPLFSSGGSTPNITIQPATTSQDGYLSSTDWNTFNNKQNALTNPVTGTGTTNFLPKFTSTSTIENSIAYDGGSSIGINTIFPYAPSSFKLDVNGGILIKNTSGTTAVLTLIDADPNSGGNNGFVQMTAGGTSSTSYGSLQTYYGTSIVGGTLRLQPSGGNVLINRTTDSGTALQVTGAIEQTSVTSSMLKTDLVGLIVAAVAGTDYVIPSTLNNYVPITRTLSINGVSYDLSADRSWTITAGISSVSGTSPISVSTISGDATVSISQATTSTDGYLSSSDWTTFNNKVPPSRTLTINGTTYDLSANRSWTITPNINATTTQDYTATAGQVTFTVTGGYTVGQLAVFYNGSKLASNEFTATDGSTFTLATACQVNDIVQAVASVTGGGIGGSGATGQVAYWNGSGTQTGTNNFYWDNTNVQLGVGTNAPSAGVTSYSTVPATQFKAAGVAPAFTFSNTLLSPTLGCVFGLATGSGQFVTGTAAGDMAIANQSATAGAIVFGTGTTERMRMTSAGTLSIGNTNTTFKLDVTGTGRFTDALTATQGNFFQTAASGFAINMKNRNANQQWSMVVDVNAVDDKYLGLYDATNGAYRMVYANNGNVGIGTTSPSDRLNVRVTANGNNARFDGPTSGLIFQTNATTTDIISYGGITPAYRAMNFSTSAGTNMTITTGGNVGIGSTSPSTNSLIRELLLNQSVTNGVSKLSLKTDYNSQSGEIAMSSYLSENTMFIATLSNSPIAFNTNSTERMRIASNGSVAIGSSSINSVIRLAVTGVNQASSHYSFISADSLGGTIIAARNDTAIFAPGVYNFTTGSGANVVVFSDGSMQRSTSSLKYKNNVQDYTKGLNEVMQLRPVTYESKNPREEGVTFAGLIAEEVHDLGLTEFVQYAEDGTPDALAYSNMVALLVKSIQELEARLKTLENK